MQPEWKKFEAPPSLGELGKGLEAYLTTMQTQLESESKKIQHLLDLVLVELQNQLDKSK